jgi:cytochrome c-type biogenesis protein CcmH
MKKFIFLTAFTIYFFQQPVAIKAQQFLPATDHQETIPADSLSTEQYGRAGKLANMLMAPCCYSKTAAEDQSGAAYGVKMEVRRGILEGYSDAEILKGFARVYGERILAQPTAVGFNKMAWIMPVVVLFIGVFIYIGFIRRTRAKPEEKTGMKRQAVRKSDAPYLKRLERELGDY